MNSLKEVLINRDGFTPEEADKEIETVIKNEIKRILGNECWGYYDMNVPEITDKIWEVVKYKV